MESTLGIHECKLMKKKVMESHDKLIKNLSTDVESLRKETTEEAEKTRKAAECL